MNNPEACEARIEATVKVYLTLTDGAWAIASVTTFDTSPLDGRVYCGADHEADEGNPHHDWAKVPELPDIDQLTHMLKNVDFWPECHCGLPLRPTWDDGELYFVHVQESDDCDDPEPA